MNNFVNYKVIFDAQGNYDNSVQQVNLICQPSGVAKQAVPRLYDTSVTPPTLKEKPNENTVTYLLIYDCDGTYIVVDETIETFSEDYIATCSLCQTPVQAVISDGLFAQTGNSTTITGTTERTLIDGGVGTLTVPANGFKVGDSFRAIFGGILNTGNNQTIRIRVKTGNVTLLDSGVKTITNITNNVFNLNIDFTIRQIGAAGTASIVSLGTFHYLKTVNGTTEGFGFNTVNNTTFDTTISNTLDVTVQWGSTSASNTIYSDIFILNKTY